MSIFSNRLISLRKQRGITQVDLAKVVGKTRSTISGYEKEGKEPDYSTLCSFARYFDVSIDYLLGLSDMPHHVDVVLVGDNSDFKKTYDALPASQKKTVDATFDDFYRLLRDDIHLARADHLSLYREMFGTIWSMRSEISTRIAKSGGQVDVADLSALMSLQGELKSSVSAILDQLMQADMQSGSGLTASIGSLEEKAM